jgi:hypothetical protein
MSLFPIDGSFAQKGINPQRKKLNLPGTTFEITAIFCDGAQL